MTNFIEFYKHFSFLKCCDCGVAGWSRLASEVTVASDITIKYVKNDNRQTLRLLNAQTPILTTKLRHVDISQHWLRERVQNGDIHVKWVATSNMTTDRFTKALPRQKQEGFVKQLGLVDIGGRLPT